MNRNFLMVAGGIVLVFALIVGYSIYSRDRTVNEYNGFEFEQSGEAWTVTAQKGSQPYLITFYYAPWELEDIVAEPAAEQLLLEKAMNPENVTVFISVDPDLNSKVVIAGTEIAKLTGDRYQILNLQTRGALLKEPSTQTADTQNPIVTCANVNNEIVVIELRQGPANLVREENGCIIIEGNNEEQILRAADRFAYMLLGIMN